MADAAVAFRMGGREVLALQCCCPAAWTAPAALTVRSGSEQARGLRC